MKMSQILQQEFPVEPLKPNAAAGATTTRQAAAAEKGICGRAKSAGAEARRRFCGLCGPAEAVPLLQSCRIWWPGGVFPQAVKPVDLFDVVRPG
jgi:hypothetical protein